jgi:hypothetical protein
MLLITPGIDFIVRGLVDFLLPCAAVYPTLAIGSSRLLGLEIPKWILLVSSVGLRVGFIVARPWINEYKNSRAARAHGAALAFHVKENHFELVKTLIHEIDDGYPGEPLAKPVDCLLRLMFQLRHSES